METDKISLVKLDETYMMVIAERHILLEINELFCFEAPNSKFDPRVRNGYWDGKIRLFKLNEKKLYVGLLDTLIQYAIKNSYELDIDPALYPYDINIDEEYVRNFISSLDLKVTVRDYQLDSLVKLFQKGRAICLSPTGSGKSFLIFLCLLFALKESEKGKALIIVPRVDLVNQLKEEFEGYIGKKLPIHTISSGAEKDTNYPITISTWQSIYKQEPDWFLQFDILIGDEVHNFKAKSLIYIVESMKNAFFRFGFTGTLDGTLTNKMVLEGLFGKTMSVTTTKKLMNEGYLADLKIIIHGLNYPIKERKQLYDIKFPKEGGEKSKEEAYFKELEYILSHEKRNAYILNLAKSLKGNTLLLFRFVEYGKMLYNTLKDEGYNVHFISGEIKPEERDEIKKSIMSSDQSILVASFGTYAEGVNIPNLHSVIFSSPNKGKIKVLQSIGRAIRTHSSKECATLHDIVDVLEYRKQENFALKHFNERMEMYSKEDFEYEIKEIEL